MTVYPPREYTSPAARFLAGGFAILFVIATVTAVFGLLADRQLFHPEVYRSALEAEGLYDRFPSVIAEQVKARGMVTGNPIFRYTRDDQLEDMFRDLFPPDWVRAQAGSASEGLFVYINGQSPQPSMPVSLVEVKDRARGEQGKTFAEAVILSWPDCSVQQLLDLTKMNGIEDLPVCKPPEFLRPTVVSVLQAGLFSPLLILPDTVDLAIPVRAASGIYGIGAGFDRGIRAVRTARQWIGYSGYVALGSLALVTLFGVRTVRSWLYWWGVPLLSAGVVTAVVTLILLIGLAIAMQLMANNLAGSPAPLLGGLVRTILGYVGLRYLLLTGLAALILTGAGTLLAWLSWRLGGRERLSPYE